MNNLSTFLYTFGVSSDCTWERTLGKEDGCWKLENSNGQWKIEK